MNKVCFAHLVVVACLVGCGADNGVKEARIINAAKRGDLEGVKAVVPKDKAAMYQKDQHGNTPLIVAILHGHNEVAVYLLDQGYPVNGSADAPFPPVMACLSGYTKESTEMLRVLLERRADPNVWYAKEGWLPLNMAVNNLMTEKVRILAEYGADFSLRWGTGETALELAERKLARSRDLTLDEPHGELRDPKRRAALIKRWEEMVNLLKQLMNERKNSRSLGQPTKAPKGIIG
jgi:ankyrin repeat protein